jgi:hypothetical protein
MKALAVTVLPKPPFPAQLSVRTYDHTAVAQTIGP